MSERRERYAAGEAAARATCPTCGRAVTWEAATVPIDVTHRHDDGSEGKGSGFSTVYRALPPPAPDPLTARERAVVEAVREWAKDPVTRRRAQSARMPWLELCVYQAALSIDESAADQEAPR